MQINLCSKIEIVLISLYLSQEPCAQLGIQVGCPLSDQMLPWAGGLHVARQPCVCPVLSSSEQLNMVSPSLCLGGWVFQLSLAVLWFHGGYLGCRTTVYIPRVGGCCQSSFPHLLMLNHKLWILHFRQEPLGEISPQR